MENIVVTGGNRGLGYEIVKGLENQDFHIIIACRNLSKAQEALKDFEGSYDILELDLTSIESIKTFVGILKEKYGVIDILVNNAGIFENTETVISFAGHDLEKMWVTNTFGPYILTKEMAPLLNKAKRPKCVFMCSKAGHHKQLNAKTIFGYDNKDAYGQSKYGDILISAYFAKHYPLWRVIAVHPGYSNTAIFDGHKPGPIREIVRFGTNILAQDPRIGARPALLATLHPFPSGTYLVPKHMKEFFGDARIRTLEDYYVQEDYQRLIELIEVLFKGV